MRALTNIKNIIFSGIVLLAWLAMFLFDDWNYPPNGSNDPMTVQTHLNTHSVNSQFDSQVFQKSELDMEENLQSAKTDGSEIYSAIGNLNRVRFYSNLYEQYQSLSSQLSTDSSGTVHLALAKVLEHCYREVENNLSLDDRLKVVRAASAVIDDTDFRVSQRITVVRHWYQDCKKIATSHSVTDYFNLKKKSAYIGNKQALFELGHRLTSS